MQLVEVVDVDQFVPETENVTQRRPAPQLAE